MIEKAADLYAEKVTQRPVAVLAVSLVAVVLLASGSSKVATEQQDVNDFLPDTYESIEAFDTIDREFSAESTTYTVLMETDPSYSNSTEIRDVRNPEFLRYVQRISREAEELQRVRTVDSAADLFNDIPPTQRQVERTLDNLGKPRWSQFLTDDFSAARMQIEAVDLTPDEQMDLAEDIQYSTESHERPAGVKLTYTGQTFIDQAFQDETGNTMSVTTQVAFLLVLAIVIMLFRSVFFGLISLEALIFGIIAGFGTFGWLGFNLSPSTSGAISIGIGIAVDFGIQPVSRYREERNEDENGMEKSLATTLKGIARPMTLGLIAALIGFSSLSIGDITFLSSLGVILSLTTLMAYIAAFTILPPTLILHDRYSHLLPDPKKYFSKVKLK